ncbi:nucleotide exchange factor GrpE [Myxococcota bacterium]|nr:nucleotide exchange factor GrpE [Myxococcota bacterium]
MNKPKRDHHPVQEAPTEWRKILLEEGPNGEMIPVGLEPVTPQPSAAKRAANHPASPSSPDLPDEWQSVFEEASIPQKNRSQSTPLSLQQELPEFSEHTIPGMQLPDILKKEMQDPDQSKRVVSHIQNAPQVQEILNQTNNPKIPPPQPDLPLYNHPLLSPEPNERTLANPRLPAPPQPKKPLVVPSPQVNEQDAAPNAIPAPLAATLGRAPISPVESHTPPDLQAYADETQDPPTYDSHAQSSPTNDSDFSNHYSEHDLSYDEHDLRDADTNFLDDELHQLHHHDAPLTNRLHDPHASRELHATPPPSRPAHDSRELRAIPPSRPIHDSRELRAIHPSHPSHDSRELHETTEASSHEHTATTPIPQPPQSPLDPQTHHAIASLRQSITEQQAQLRDLLDIATEQRTLAQKQHEENSELRRSIERLRAELDTDREETRFQALYAIFQDLLLLFDYVDLRYRSLWDTHGEHHPAVLEASGFRERLLSTLKEQGLEPIDIHSYLFDPTSHRALQEVHTPHTNEDQQISRIFRQGFRFQDKVFRPTEVEIKRYAP